MRLSALNTEEGSYSEPIFWPVHNAMGERYSKGLLDWCVDNWGKFTLGGDGDKRRNYELPVVLDHCPMIPELYERIGTLLTAACDACKIDRFVPHWTEGHAMVFHDGQRFGWHSDHYKSSDLHEEETRTITFLYYMQQTPRLFTGGELEFFDGSMIDHADDMLLFIDPWQRHQVREVACKLSNPRDGRWAISGWVHRHPTGVVPDWKEWDDRLNKADGFLQPPSR